MISGDDSLAYNDVFRRIGELAEVLEGHPDPSVAKKVSELLDWVDAFHRDGLGRLVEMIREWRGEIFLEAVAADPITGVLLDAYGLGQGPEATVEAVDAVTAALEPVRPLVESHGGAIEIEAVVDGVVTVRLMGTCDGCPSSSATLTYGVEAALRDGWPHFRRLEVADLAETTDAEKAALECLAAPLAASPAVLVQIRGREASG